LKPSSSNSTPISTPTAKLNLGANGKPGTTSSGARKLPYEEYESNSILHILNVSSEMVTSEFPDLESGRVGKDESDTLLIAKLSVETKEGEEGGVTIFEYLTGCWKRVHRVNREGLRMVGIFYYHAGLIWHVTGIRRLTKSLCLSAFCGSRVTRKTN
jgi:hypothetical protein